MAFLSGNIAVCETILWEQNTNVPTLVRLMSVLSLHAESTTARFLVVTLLNSQPGDTELHSMFIHITEKQGAVVASTEPFEFRYGYELDHGGAGGFTMTTTFTLDLAKIPIDLPCHLLVQAFLDKVPTAVAVTPLLIRLNP
jgi:hypothetical protein